jgi:Domain of unknown function (DUF222)/HNH endonuclease
VSVLDGTVACMSVEQLRAPVVAGHIAGARHAVEEAAGVPAGTLDRHELGEAVAELHALEAQVASLKLSMLAEAERRRVAEETADTGTDAWAARLTGSTRVAVAGGIWLANLLRDRYAATREAFAAGHIDVDQVKAVVTAAQKMPGEVSEPDRVAAEEELVAKAVAGMNARRLRQAGRRMLEAVSKELADRSESSQLKDEEKTAEVETWLRLDDRGDGTVAGRFVVPELQAHFLRAALERLSAPRRWTVNKQGKQVEDDTLPGEGLGLNYTERLGVAFMELLEHLPTVGHGANGATVLVQVDEQHLRDGLASAGLDGGTRISVGQARRLACNAGIVPVVLGGASEVLDLGRKRRLHTEGQRRALAISYDTCAAEGCERPFSWCEVHHPHAWSRGGRTDLGNALPLCGYHHRRAHDERFSLIGLAAGEVRFKRRGGGRMKAVAEEYTRRLRATGRVPHLQSVVDAVPR